MQRFSPPTKQHATRCAKALKKHLIDKGFPICEVRLFGSSLRNETHKWSDIDIAVLCMPFLKTKHDENVEFLLASKDIDLRIETICLHPEDLENRCFGVAQDVKKYGIPV